MYLCPMYVCLCPVFASMFELHFCLVVTHTFGSTLDKIAAWAERFHLAAHAVTELCRSSNPCDLTTNFLSFFNRFIKFRSTLPQTSTLFLLLSSHACLGLVRVSFQRAGLIAAPLGFRTPHKPIVMLCKANVPISSESSSAQIQRCSRPSRNPSI